MDKLTFLKKSYDFHKNMENEICIDVDSGKGSLDDNLDVLEMVKRIRKHLLIVIGNFNDN